MLETSDERRERLQRNALITFFTIIIILLITAGIVAWDSYAPLPNTKECESKGYDGGMIMDGKNFCYNQCSTNKLDSCKEMRAIGVRL